MGPDATIVEIEQAYHEQTQNLSLNQRLGSARAEAAETLLRLTQAYEILSDPIQRSHHDLMCFGRERLPLCEQVQQLFQAGIRAYRQQRLELAMRYYKEAARLYPHRALFRVHLAIIFAEKQWLTNAENELSTALHLDPDDRFAKETIARLLFEYAAFSREPREPLMRRVGTGLLSLVRTGPLGRGSKTQEL